MVWLLGIIAIAQGIVIVVNHYEFKRRLRALELSRDAQRDRMTKLESETSEARKIVRVAKLRGELREQLRTAQ